MKTPLLFLTLLAAGSVTSHAQVTTTERTEVRADGSVSSFVTTSSGTVKAVGDGALVITGNAADEPSRYVFGDGIVYVDEAGRPVSFDVVQVGVPVSVEWVKRGGLHTAQKVTVKKSVAQHADGTVTARKTTTTTEPMEAVIVRTAPQSISVTTTKSTTPITMVRTARTTFVDVEGNPIPAELVTADLPVKVQYTRDGSAYQVSKVTVQRRIVRAADGSATLAPAAPAVIKRTETVTETVRETE